MTASHSAAIVLDGEGLPRRCVADSPDSRTDLDVARGSRQSEQTGRDRDLRHLKRHVPGMTHHFHADIDQFLAERRELVGSRYWHAPSVPLRPEVMVSFEPVDLTGPGDPGS